MDQPTHLLPCPFCGCTKSPVLQGNGIGDNWLECTDCGASTRLREGGAGSTKDWNRRPTPSAPAVDAGARHVNDDTPSDPQCAAALAKLDAQSGQGVDPYWAWGFRKGWSEACAALSARASEAAAGEPMATMEFMPVDGMQHLNVQGSPEAIDALKKRMERDYRIAAMVPGQAASGQKLTDEQIEAINQAIQLARNYGWAWTANALDALLDASGATASDKEEQS